MFSRDNFKMKSIFIVIALMAFALNTEAKEIPKEKFPVFTNTIYLKCTNLVPGYCDVVHAPFEVVLGNAQLASEASLSDVDIFSGVMKGISYSKFDMMYENYIKEMRKNSQDSSYFAGNVTFVFTIDSSGVVESIYIETSTTNNNAFDEKLKQKASKWIFKKSNGKTKFKLPIQFKRTKYSGKEIEREKIEIEGGVAPRSGGNL